MKSAIKSTDKTQKLKGKSRKSLDNCRQYSPKGGNIVMNGKQAMIKWKVPLNQQIKKC
jgi:hypothetical protein